MTDDTLWVAVLTASTAVVASWVTSKGNASAARLQAEVTGQSQRLARQREARRASYADLIERAVALSELYWDVPEAAAIDDPDAQKKRLLELRSQIRNHYALLLRCVHVIALEGPDEVSEAAKALHQATPATDGHLQALIEDNHSAMDEFWGEYRVYQAALSIFVERASSTVRSM